MQKTSIGLVMLLILLPSVAPGQPLAGYRDFRLGMSPEAVSAQVGPSPEVQTIHKRPTLIQEILWYPARGQGTLAENEVIRSLVFTFYAGELCRMVIEYERARTEGLTGDDVIEVLAAQYGQASRPRVPMMGSLSGSSYLGDQIVASWQDARFTVTLFQPSFLSSFALSIVDRRLDGLLRQAVAEAARLDDKEGPQRERDRRAGVDEESRVRLAKARDTNKASFKP